MKFIPKNRFIATVSLLTMFLVGCADSPETEASKVAHGFFDDYIDMYERHGAGDPFDKSQMRNIQNQWLYKSIDEQVAGDIFYAIRKFLDQSHYKHGDAPIGISDAQVSNTIAQATITMATEQCFLNLTKLDNGWKVSGTTCAGLPDLW